MTCTSARRTRWAMTNIGVLEIANGGLFTTAQCRRALKAQGIDVQYWGRNWASFLGYLSQRTITLPLGRKGMGRTL